MVIRTLTELNDLVNILKQQKVIAFDTEYVDYGGFPDIHLVGMSFSWDGKNGAYIPVGHTTGELQLDMKDVIKEIKPILEDESKIIVMHNAKADIESMWLQGVYIHDSAYWNYINNKLNNREYPNKEEFSYIPKKEEKHIFDTMIASWLLDQEREYGLKFLSNFLLGKKMTELTDLAKKEKGILRVDKVPISALAPYAGDDAIQTFKLRELFVEQIKEAGLEKVYYELEMPLVKVLAEMEIFGTPANEVLLSQIGEKIQEELRKTEEKIYSLRPNKEPFNINSTQQLNQVLFNELKIPPIGEVGKNGLYSTNADMLLYYTKKFNAYQAGMSKRGENFEICKWLLRYRKLTKIYSTYVEGMKSVIKSDGKIHCTFWQTGTETGRLSSSNPNLQNIPTDHEFAIRKIFYAPSKEYNEKYGLPFNEMHNWKWCTFDESQLELRVGAHLSNDKTMIEMFNQGKDLHSMTAWTCFKLQDKCSLDEVKEKFPVHRKKAKKINFGIFYRMGARTLTEDINKEMDNPQDYITEEEAKEVIKNFFESYSGVKDFINKCIDTVHKTGKIKTITGRYRMLRNATLNPNDFKNPAEKREVIQNIAKAERQSVNTPVQGSAADIVAIAMRNIRNRFMESLDWGVNIKMLLQVHDEISCIIREDLAEEFSKIIKYEMENPVKLRVPLEAEGAIGESWYDCH